MLRQGVICYTGSRNSKEKKVLCSVVSLGLNCATVRLWEGQNFNKVVTVPFTSGKYLQPVKGGAKSACVKRIIKNKVYTGMNDTALKQYLQELSREMRRRSNGYVDEHRLETSPEPRVGADPTQTRQPQRVL